VSNNLNFRSTLTIICPLHDVIAPQQPQISWAWSFFKLFTLPDAKEKRESSVISNTKLKFEATLLDKKSSAEVKKGLFLTNDTLLFLDKTNKHIFLCDKNGKVSHKINLIHEP
jgi:hypothetical protein